MDASNQIQLISPDSPQMWEETRQILREYAQSLTVDLCFQGAITLSRLQL